MKFAESKDGLIHVISPTNAEYTLCGNAFEGFDGDDKGWRAVVRKPITCTTCADAVRAIKALKCDYARRSYQ